MIYKLTKEKANRFKGLHLYNRLPRVQSQQTLNETYPIHAGGDKL